MESRHAAIRVHAAALLLLLGGCATYPSGPRVTAFPGTGMSFEQFRIDDFNCREFALRAIGGNPAQDSARQGAIDSAIARTAVGAAAGALIGSASGNPGAGAAIGAGSGLVLGSLAGTDAYQTSGSRTQSRYDTARYRRASPRQTRHGRRPCIRSRHRARRRRNPPRRIRRRIHHRRPVIESTRTRARHGRRAPGRASPSARNTARRRRRSPAYTSRRARCHSARHVLR